MPHGSLDTKVSFNSQPPEGGWEGWVMNEQGEWVSTHSRPKAAGWGAIYRMIYCTFQLTAARRRLVAACSGLYSPLKFQLTAARRRLDAFHSGRPPVILFQLTAARRRLDKFKAL